jgi:hypothetical protein
MTGQMDTKRARRRGLVLVVLIGALPAAPAATSTSAKASVDRQQPPPAPVREMISRPTAGGPGQTALPPLSEEAQRLVDQLKQNFASTIEQLRFLQLTYRDSGRAEDAAAIAAQVRLVQQFARLSMVSGTATVDLVNEGLPVRDTPITMSMFRAQAGQTLSFAIRGRDDLPVWGTTTYTDDSPLEAAAVHAGLLRAGQSGIVKVRPLPGQDRYEASNQNGVQSLAYGPQRGSYSFGAVSIATRARTSSLSSYRDLVGQSITLPVLGTVAGSVWGSDVYTDDSSLGAAAVHAGVLGVGDFAFVKVTLLPGQSRYDGSPRYGVTSQNYGSFDGSFRVERAPEPWTVQLPGGEDASRLVPLSTLRGRPGSSFIVQVVGAANGPVWGSGAYTDDSSIAAAAVHAGLLKPGEVGFVRVTVEAGRDSYEASERNGVKTQPFGKFDGTFRLARATR